MEERHSYNAEGENNKKSDSEGGGHRGKKAAFARAFFSLVER